MFSYRSGRAETKQIEMDAMSLPISAVTTLLLVQKHREIDALGAAESSGKGEEKVPG